MPLHCIPSHRYSLVAYLERALILPRGDAGASGYNEQVIGPGVLKYLQVLSLPLANSTLTSILVHLYANLYTCLSMLFLHLRHLYFLPKPLPFSLLVVTGLLFLNFSFFSFLLKSFKFYTDAKTI